MNAPHGPDTHELGPRLGNWPLPGKILVTIIIIMMAIGFAGALGQIIFHDIIPTFWSEKSHLMTYTKAANKPTSDRGDLIADSTAKNRGDLIGDIAEEKKIRAEKSINSTEEAFEKIEKDVNNLEKELINAEKQ